MEAAYGLRTVGQVLGQWCEVPTVLGHGQRMRLRYHDVDLVVQIFVSVSGRRQGGLSAVKGDRDVSYVVRVLGRQLKVEVL